MKRITSDVNKIVERIASSTYICKGLDGKLWDAPVIHKDAISTLLNILNEELAEVFLEKAELEAKCYAYEAIISNSNFQPVIKPHLLNSRGDEI